MGKISSALLLGLAMLAAPAHAEPRQVVLTGLQATTSLVSALAEGTAIEVTYPFPASLRMEQQAGWFEQKPRPDFVATAQTAAAAVTLRHAWEGDPLYVWARGANIRVVPIDASLPFNPKVTGIGVLPRAVGKGPSPWAWHSLANAMRMADILAADLAALDPADAARIERNQIALKMALQGLKTEYESRFLEAGSPGLWAMTDRFAYLVRDFGLDMVGQTVLDTYDWGPTEFAALTKALKDTDARVVLDWRKPKAELEAAVSAAGARLVVLDSMDPPARLADGRVDPAGFQNSMRGNLEALHRAMTGK